MSAPSPFAPDPGLEPMPPPVLPEIKVPQLIRIVIVDDSAFVRKVVREMLSRSPFIEVVGVARDGEEYCLAHLPRPANAPV